MAEEAFLVKPDGSLEQVRAENLTDEDRKNRFLCCGIGDEGILCAIDMRLSAATMNKKRHFYPGGTTIKHLPGCSKCRERKVIIAEKLDQSGKRTTVEKLFERMNQDTALPPEKGYPPTDEGGNGVDEPTTDLPQDDHVETEERDVPEKEIQRRLRNPRNIDEYTALLAILSLDDEYAGRQVRDQILDERTITGYRQDGEIPTGKPFVIFARKAIPGQYNVYLENDQWFLIDAFGRRENAFRFILNVSAEAKKKLWNLCNINPAVKIVLQGVFYKHPTLPNTYISDPNKTIKAKIITAKFADEP